METKINQLEIEINNRIVVDKGISSCIDYNGK